ncbi:DNA polymerase domain-containing protein [Nocardia stercoris]|uniref:ATP-dependent DNA ligase n=1 Tax=Nocardia stercoris TaxID=2483361 RepID=A0A3M2LCJ6_9NOCA|nr:ATP-dependent DNA ligase [Nocardia stercoris]RMI34816.1 ATP-dependent DNA ligase [Nocardia stercoris]
MPADEVRAGVELTNLDAELFDGAGATKRDLIDYLEAVADRLLAAVRGRPLSVLRVRPGQAPFMQKNLPKYTPEWVPRVRWWAETSHRNIDYALCDDLRTLLWFGNQRAVEFHVPLVTADQPEYPTALVLDIDPPEGDSFAAVVRAAELVRTALADSGLAGGVKTSGAKGVHILIPVAGGIDMADAAAATRALAARAERLDPDVATTAFIREDRGGKVFLDSTRAGGATLAAAYSPRIRPGTTVSFPVSWAALSEVTPADFTVRTALSRLDTATAGDAEMPAPQPLPADLVAEGHTIPVARVQAMHEGKRRARAKRAES